MAVIALRLVTWPMIMLLAVAFWLTWYAVMPEPLRVWIFLIEALALILLLYQVVPTGIW